MSDVKGIDASSKELHTPVQARRRCARAAGKTATEVARSLGIARSFLQRWKEQLESKKEHAFPENGNAGSDRERVCALEKEIRDVREERNILKKAYYRTLLKTQFLFPIDRSKA